MQRTGSLSQNAAASFAGIGGKVPPGGCRQLQKSGPENRRWSAPFWTKSIIPSRHLRDGTASPNRRWVIGGKPTKNSRRVIYQIPLSLVSESVNRALRQTRLSLISAGESQAVASFRCRSRARTAILRRANSAQSTAFKEVSPLSIRWDLVSPRVRFLFAHAHEPGSQ